MVIAHDILPFTHNINKKYKFIFTKIIFNIFDDLSYKKNQTNEMQRDCLK